MKVIDLLNKIANGEEVPRKIKWGEFELEWEELGYHDYKFLGTGNHLLFQGFATSVLNDEVEIIEEDKEIEEVHNDYSLPEIPNDSNTAYLVYRIMKHEDKINELIKAVNELKKGE